MYPKRKNSPDYFFCAGSLIKPFDDLEKAFEEKYPSIDVQNECHGSIQVIRHVTDIHKEIDIVATADANLIPMLMYSTNDPNTGLPYADWYIKLATNQIGIAYSEKSKYKDEINSENWLEVITRPDVRSGLSDPRFDALGYRQMMIVDLASIDYAKPAAFFNLYGEQFKYPVLVESENNIDVIHIPEILETKEGSHIVVRGSSVQLIALLESGDLDYAFEYESVIQQHNLGMVELPDTLNLGSSEQIDSYRRATVKLDFQRFLAVKPVFMGDQITYGITIPSNSPHPKEAAQFIAFILSPQGREIMLANHHPLYNQPAADGFNNLPDILKTLTITTQ